MATDIVGYSRLMEADEEGTLKSIRMLRAQVIDPIIAEYKGRLVKLMGDGAIVEFGSVVDAVACAVALQKEISHHQAAITSKHLIVLRIGIHLGDVVIEENDLLGDGVNVAARLEQLCEPGEVLISGSVYDQLPGKLTVSIVDAGIRHVKNIVRPIRAYKVRIKMRKGVGTRGPFSRGWVALSRTRYKTLGVIGIVTLFCGMFLATSLPFIKEDVATTRESREIPDKIECADGALAAIGSGDKGLIRCLKAGDIFADCEKCPEMVVVPVGSFLMGSPSDEEGVEFFETYLEERRFTSEQPQHWVNIDHGLAVGRFEVTFEEWDACVADGGCYGYRPRDKWGRDRQPVTMVSWTDAMSYVYWLSQETHREYRLLSEAEWEYSARAGTTTPFSTGQTISTDQANFNGTFTYGGGSKGVNRAMPLKVGHFSANAFGLHDMHGNVAEWVEDCWKKNYEGAPTDGSPWFDEVWCDDWRSGGWGQHVQRGGSWVNAPHNIRSARRQSGPDGRYSTDSDNGFRVARALPKLSTMTISTLGRAP